MRFFIQKNRVSIVFEYTTSKCLEYPLEYFLWGHLNTKMFYFLCFNNYSYQYDSTKSKCLYILNYIKNGYRKKYV